jgi:hypothetical protein
MPTTGTFEKYRVVHQIHLGKFQIDLPKDATIEFDGQIVKYAGKDYAEPIVSGALKAGWLVKLSDVTSKFVPQSAGVQVRPATAAGQERGELMKIDSAAAEEEVVGSLAATNARRASGVPAHKEPAAQKNRPQPNKVAATADPVKVSKAEPSPVDVDYKLSPAPEQSSEGVPVARFGKPSVQKIVLTDARQVTAEISKVEAGGPVRTKKFAVVKSDADQAAPNVPNPASKATEPPTATGKPRPKANDDAEGGDSITKVATNGATGDVAEARSGGDDLADLLPDAASSGVPGKPAKFEWDMSGHWRNRVKTALEKYANNPTALKSIYAVESESVVKNIKSGLLRK